MAAQPRTLTPNRLRLEESDDHDRHPRVRTRGRWLRVRPVVARFADPLDQARIALALGPRRRSATTSSLASSMGDEVLVHLASEVDPRRDVLFLDTGYHFAETLGTAARRTTHVRPITLITVTPPQTVAEQDATEGADLFARDPDRCCALRKVEPLERGLAPYAAWITGMRRDDAPTRTDIEVIGWDARRSKVKLNPLAAWTDEDVAAYAESHDVLLNPLRQVGYASIGCAPCTIPLPWRRSPRRPLVGPRQDGMRVAHMSTTILKATQPTLAVDHLVGAGERGHPHHAGGGRRVRTARAAVQRRQGLGRACCTWRSRRSARRRCPFPLLHVDTGHNFPEVIEYRDRTVARTGRGWSWPSVQDCIDDGGLRERPDGTRNPLQTVPLLDAIARAAGSTPCSAARRRDEEKARAKERIFSLRDEFGQWDPRRQRPELWNLYNGRHAPGRARPGVPAVELDRARRLALHRARGHRAAVASTTPTSARSSCATACG